MSRHDTSDLIFRRVLAAFPITVLIIVAGIFFELVYSSLPSLHKFGIGFLYHSIWNPVEENFGALPFIYGTCVTSLVALLLAVPIGVGAAIYLVEYAPVKVSRVISTLVDLLAAIPSVIYGLWGIFVLVPFMRNVVQPFLGKYFGFLPLFQGPNYGIGMLAASVMLAIIIVPFIISVSREVIAAVPFVYKESAYALGATRWEALSNIVLSYGKAGILGAVILALGRAIGEVMAVTMIIGNDPKIALSLFSPGYTLASVIANEFAEADFPMYLSALIEIALVLFLVAIIVNILARLLIWSVTGAQSAEAVK
ncbi:MAG: phosphate ABC transporter permease subunit PstC [Candidatus Omnitrophica bacterium]|nr:phosphate ABC transporter permease subunit PstC [Candidatus Omnitrophota bacterium]